MLYKSAHSQSIAGCRMVFYTFNGIRASNEHTGRGRWKGHQSIQNKLIFVKPPFARLCGSRFSWLFCTEDLPLL